MADRGRAGSIGYSGDSDYSPFVGKSVSNAIGTVTSPSLATRRTDTIRSTAFFSSAGSVASTSDPPGWLMITYPSIPGLAPHGAIWTQTQQTGFLFMWATASTPSVLAS